MIAHKGIHTQGNTLGNHIRKSHKETQGKHTRNIQVSKQGNANGLTHEQHYDTNIRNLRTTKGIPSRKHTETYTRTAQGNTHKETNKETREEKRTI